MEATDKDIEAMIKKWLGTARDRDGGRARRFKERYPNNEQS